LNDHPELAAVGPDSKPISMNMFSSVACPSKKVNLEWFKRALEWMCDEFKIEGAQIEVGDYAVCYCDDCKKKRGDKTDNAHFSLEDMVEPYTAAYDVLKKSDPASWVICETYSSFADPNEDDTPGHFGSAFNESQKRQLCGLPADAIIQWAMDWAVPYKPTQTWPDTVYLPRKNNISRIHHGSQHSMNSIDEWAVSTIGDMVKKSRICGVNGVSIFGEESPASPPNEANYLVFSEFSGCGTPNPNCDLDLFFSQTLDPLYGGAGMAKEWRRMYITAHTLRMDIKNNLRLINESSMAPFYFHHNYYEIGEPGLFEKAIGMSPDEKQKLTLKLAHEARSISKELSGESCRRWAWLENWLWRAEYIHRTGANG